MKLSSGRYPTHPVIAELIEIRRAWRLTRKDLEKRAGVGGRTIQSAEIGQKNPNLRSLAAWAEALGYELVLRPKTCRSE